MNTKLSIKKELIDLCSALQIKRLEVVKTAMDEAQQSANDYGMPKDRYDSFRMQLLRKRDILGQQLQKTNMEFIALQKINLTKEQTKVAFGAVVITNTQKLFISISIGKIELGKNIYYAISPNVPIYNCIEGLKIGQEFTFQGVKNQIVDLF